METDQPILARRPDLALINKIRMTCQFFIPEYHRLKGKESEKPESCLRAEVVIEGDDNFNDC